VAEALTPLTPEHRERTGRALDAIERAQQLLGDAAELLCPVPGMVDEWESVRTLSFEARTRWDAVHASLSLLDRDQAR